MAVDSDSPRMVDCTLQWACCQSSIGPACGHRDPQSLIDYSGALVDTPAESEPVIRHHERGGPDCSEVCDASEDRHRGDPPRGWPEVCDGCGGSGYQCYPRCLYGDRGRAYEPWEGRTGAHEAWGDDEAGVRGMPWVTG